MKLRLGVQKDQIALITLTTLKTHPLLSDTKKRIKLYKSLFGIRQDRGISLIIFLQILQLLALQLRKNRLAAEKLNENGRKFFKM